MGTMGTTKVGINGFGRIGRCFVRALVERNISDLEVVAVNDLTDPKTLAHLLKYDSVHRTFRAAEIRADGTHQAIRVGDRDLQVLAIKDPRELPWKSLGVELVIESTGLFTDAEKAKAHLSAGAAKVLISAPAKNHDGTFVLGVNDDAYDPRRHQVVSIGSCTTNCLAPLAKVVLDDFGIVYGLMTTVHSYTNDQAILDVPHRKGDLRRARAAAVSMIPTSTGAAKAISEVIPALKGKFDGGAVRVPTMDVSLVDLTVETERPATKDTLHAALRRASQGKMKGILYYQEEPLVSSDYIGHPGSSIFDATMTQVLGDRFVKLCSWYDNEWGFANRLLDFSVLMGQKGIEG